MIDWNKEFIVVSICRLDLLRHLSEEKIEKLTDEDMEQIAKKIGDVYDDNGLWEDIDFIVDTYLAEKV